MTKAKRSAGLMPRTCNDVVSQFELRHLAELDGIIEDWQRIRNLRSSQIARKLASGAAIEPGQRRAVVHKGKLHLNSMCSSKEVAGCTKSAAKPQRARKSRKGAA